MAHFDLEEQEQLAQLKHFWKRYGTGLTVALVVVLLGFSGWWGWKGWQIRQAAQATALHEELERIAAAPGEDKDGERLSRALADMKDRFPGTTQTQQAALLTAALHAQAGRGDAARAVLQWLAKDGSDEGYRALARLRLAGLLLDAKSYDDALAQLSADFPPQFAPLAADRRGDIYLAQGKKTEAGAEYLKAWQGLEVAGSAGNYRQVVDAKLAALGIQSQPATTSAGVQ